MNFDGRDKTSTPYWLHLPQHLVEFFERYDLVKEKMIEKMGWSEESFSSYFFLNGSGIALTKPKD